VGKSSGSAKQQVTEFRMSIHFGVCLSADAVTRIKIDGKVAWEGRSTTQEVISINQPNLFGGAQESGGFVGQVYHLPGGPDQLLPPELSAKLGEPDPANCVAFRRRTTLWFTGMPSYNFAPEGEYDPEVNYSTIGGALWKMNSPVIAQTVDVTVECAPKTDAGTPGTPQLDPSIAMIGPDANPAHMIYECLVDPDFGMGEDPLLIDAASFNAAAQQLFDEEFGLSIMWTRQTTVQAFIEEIGDHIQAFTFKSPRTGLWSIRLMRADYEINELRVINPQNAKLSDFQRKAWGEIANELSVTYTDPATEEDASVTAQDLGSVISQGVVAESRNYYGVRNPTLALRLAQRDARTSAAPLVALSAQVDRTIWDVEPGEVFILEWPEESIDGVVVRAMGIDYGKPKDSKIKLSLTEDIFSLDMPPKSDVPGTGWTPPGIEPEPLAASEVISIPAYFAMSADLQKVALDLVYPETLAIILGYQDNNDTSGFQLASLDDGEYASHGNKNLTEREILQTSMPFAAEGRIPAAMIQRPARGPQVGGFVFMGQGSDENMEIAKVVAFDDDTEEWVLSRGVLDTVPRNWPPGTPLWFVNKGLQIVDDQEIRSGGETVEYKLRSRTSKGLLPLDDTPEVTETLTARPHMPLRPANVQINGVSFGDVNMAAASDIAITWSTRNRLLEDGQVLTWTDASVPPEYYQGTTVSFFDGATEVYKQWGLWTESGLTLPKSYFAKYANLTVEVASAREDIGIESLQAYRVVLTGLPNNPAAPPPPNPPEPGQPPAAGAAPAEGAWTVTGSVFEAVSGSKIPAILVAGQRDRLDAEGLVVRYKKHGGNDWFYLPVLALDNGPKQTSTTSVASGTVYDVEVAYVTLNVLGKWRSLGQVTTGILAADQVGTLTQQMIEQAIQDMEDLIDQNYENITIILDAVDEALKTLDDARRELGIEQGLMAETLIERSLSQDNLTKYMESLTWLPGGKTVQTVLVNNVVVTDDLVETMSIIGVKSIDGGSFIMDMNKVYFGPDGTGAQVINAIISDFNDFHAEVVTNYVTHANQTSALAVLTIQLTSTMDAKDVQTLAYVATNYTTYATMNSAIASYDTTIKAWVTNPSAGGNPLAATVSVQGTAIANINGNLYATYTMYANSGGAMAGISILTSSGRVNYSGVIVDADNFLVKSSSYPAVQPLFYDAATGALYSNTIVVRTANIANLAVGTLKLAYGAVTKGAEAYAGSTSCSSGGETTLLSAGGTTQDGTDNRIFFSGCLNPIVFEYSSGASQLDIVTLNLYRNGTPIHSVKAGVAVKFLDIGGTSRWVMAGGLFGFNFTDTAMPTNSNTYTVTAVVSGVSPVGALFDTMDLNFMGCER
jgi:hypothetical protein